MMASGTVSSTSPRYHSSKKPPISAPTSVSSCQRVDQSTPFDFKAKPPPVPKRKAKVATNYYHLSGTLGSISSPSTASSSRVDFKPLAIAAGGSDNCNQDPDKVQCILYANIIIVKVRPVAQLQTTVVTVP